MSPDVDPTQILTPQRIGAAIGALADPNHSPTDPSLHLNDEERDGIRHAIQRSAHHLAGFAHSVLNQWDDLEDDDRVAGLLLFTQIVNSPVRDRSFRRRRVPERGVER
jgi:hypothetical protein